MRKVSAFNFLLLQKARKIYFIPFDQDEYIFQRGDDMVIKEWDFECQSISLLDTLKQNLNRQFNESLKLPLLSELAIYKLAGKAEPIPSYLILCPVNLQEIFLPDDSIVFKIRNLKKRKISEILSALIEDKNFRVFEDKHRWISHNRSKNVKIDKYSNVKDMKKITRAGILLYFQNGKDINYLLGYKHHDRTGLSDWGGGCRRSETLELCMKREFREEFGKSIDETIKISNDSKVFLIEEPDGAHFAMVVVLIENPEQFQTQFIPNKEILGIEIASEQFLYENLYTGKVDGSFAYQLQEIRRFSNSDVSSVIIR